MNKDQIISDLADALKLIRYEASEQPGMAFTLETVKRIADRALKDLNAAYNALEAIAA